MLHSWTMLFLTVPLATGREGDSCGPQGSCLLCHGPTARDFNETWFVCHSFCKSWIQYSTLGIQTKISIRLVSLNHLRTRTIPSKVQTSKLILQLVILIIRVGEACYHTEEIGVDCDKTTYGHPCCVIR